VESIRSPSQGGTSPQAEDEKGKRRSKGQKKEQRNRHHPSVASDLAHSCPSRLHQSTSENRPLLMWSGEHSLW
jgi:hypothetical protein